MRLAKTRKNGKATTHDVSGPQGLNKCSLYNIKLAGKSAPVTFPEDLKKLIQDRGYWSRFVQIKAGLFGKWIPSREQNSHLYF